jgi:hypothetical protein
MIGIFKRYLFLPVFQVLMVDERMIWFMDALRQKSEMRSQMFSLKLVS